MWSEVRHLNSAGLNGRKRQFKNKEYAMSRDVYWVKPTQLRDNNVLTGWNPLFLMGLFLKDTSFNHEGHHNGVSWPNTSHRGIVLRQSDM